MPGNQGSLGGKLTLGCRGGYPHHILRQEAGGGFIRKREDNGAGAADGGMRRCCAVLCAEMKGDATSRGARNEAPGAEER